MSNLRTIAFSISVLSLAGCGRESQVNGTFEGYSMHVKDVVFFQKNTPTLAGRELFIGFSDAPDLCVKVGANMHKPSEGDLRFVFFRNGDSQPEFSPGTYQFNDKPDANGYFAGGALEAWDNSCAPNVIGDSSTGAVTITSISATRIAGYFDVTFVTQSGGTATHLTGSFDAPVCVVPAEFTNGNPGCTP